MLKHRRGEGGWRVGAPEDNKVTTPYACEFFSYTVLLHVQQGRRKRLITNTTVVCLLMMTCAMSQFQLRTFAAQSEACKYCMPVTSCTTPDSRCEDSMSLVEMTSIHVCANRAYSIGPQYERKTPAKKQNFYRFCRLINVKDSVFLDDTILYRY